MSSRLEQYLEEVSKPISSHERVEWRTEAEQHLAALIAAYEELGYNQEEATELALNRFGEAQTVGKQVRAEMRPVMFSPATVTFLAPLLLSFVVMYLAASSFAETGNQHTLPMMLTKSGLLNGISALAYGGWVGRLLRDGHYTRRSLLYFLPLTLWAGAGVCLVGAAFFASLTGVPPIPNSAYILLSTLVWCGIAVTTAALTYVSPRLRKPHVQPN